MADARTRSHPPAAMAASPTRQPRTNNQRPAGECVITDFTASMPNPPARTPPTPLKAAPSVITRRVLDGVADGPPMIVIVGVFVVSDISALASSSPPERTDGRSPPQGGR
nr:hypothetical protein [Actinomadura geliboluensis]